MNKWNELKRIIKESIKANMNEGQKNSYTFGYIKALKSVLNKMTGLEWSKKK